MQTTQQYKLPVALQNLSPAETLNQMVDNLNFLCKVMDEAFDSISNKISEERGNIRNMTKRVEEARKKTDMIAQYPNKATRVFSQCEYPGPDKPHIDAPLVDMTQKPIYVARTKYKLSVAQRLEQPQYKDTLKLFHSLLEKTSKKKSEQLLGLGHLPDWITSVSDCLLFNTDENPYVKYQLGDNLMGEEGKEKEKEERGMFAQPGSIANRVSIMNSGDQYDMSYEPALEEVPRFQMAGTLKALGSNVALDITWQGHQASHQRIAPSSVAFQNLPDLSVLPNFDNMNFGDGGEGPPIFEDLGPPPGPPPGPGPDSGPPPSNTGPPANAPTPAAKPATPAKAKKSPPKEKPAAPKPKAAAPVGNKRMALLDQIKMGKKLKKSSERKVKKRKEAPKPMGLMDHLKQRLKQRNAAMRGVSQNNVQKDFKPPANLLDDTGEEGDTVPELPKRKKSEEDRTGLGLKNVPKHMSMAMLFDEDDASHAGSEDHEWHD